MGKGGARRLKIPTVDMEHLLDILKSYVRKSGLEGSLNFGEYFNITRPMAVNGKELAEQLEFLRGLAQVNPELVFKYSELKDIYKELEKTFPDLKHKFNLEKRANLTHYLSDATMVICNHARRLHYNEKNSPRPART